MDADFLLPALRTNFHGMKAIDTFIRMTKNQEDHLVAFRDMDSIAQDTEGLLLDAFRPIIPEKDKALGNSSRLPKRSDVPLTSREILEALQTSVDLMTLEVRILLEKKIQKLDEDEYVEIKRRTDHVIAMIGRIARYYKSSIIESHPGFWTDVLEKQFEKYLKIKPRREESI